MASRFSVEAIFRAVDKISRPLQKMGLNSKRFTRAIKRDFAKAQRSVKAFGNSIRRSAKMLASRAVAGAFIALGVGIALATREFINFDEAITAASAKFGPTFQRGTEGFKQLGKIAREVGASTEFTATQAAKGLDFLALAGFEASQAMKLLPSVVDLATAAQTDLAEASDIASDSLGAFGLMTKDSTQLSINFNRIMDVMAKTTTTSNTDLVTLFESVKKGAPSFTSAGQSLETFNALAGVMANAGVKGSDSGTALRNMMLRLAAPTGEAAKVIEKLGVETRDQAGNFLDVVDILAGFEKGLEGMGTAQRTAALATVFGARTVTGINILLSEGTDKLRTYRDTLLNASGAAGEMAGVMRTSLKNQFATLKSAAIELGFKFVETFEKDGRGAINKITEAIRNFDIQPIIQGIKTFGRVISTIFRILKSLSPIIKTVVAAFLIYKAVLIAVAIAQAIFNAVTAANPIMLIILAIGILVGVIIWLVKNWDQVVAFLRNVWAKVVDFVVGTIQKLWNKFSELLENPFFVAVGLIFAPWLTIPGLIIKHWEPIKEFFTNLWNNVIKPFVEGIGGAIGKVKEFFKTMGGGQGVLGEAFSGAGGGGRSPGVVTSGERVSRSISETTNRSEIIVRNNGSTAVDTDSGVIPPGGSIVLQPSG